MIRVHTAVMTTRFGSDLVGITVFLNILLLTTQYITPLHCNIVLLVFILINKYLI